MGLSKSALSWIHSYLTSRSQCVISKSTTSWSLDTNLGVPQGSVLVPPFFCLYINDLHLHLRDPNVFCNLYADDLQIYIQIPLDRVMEGIVSLYAAAQRVSAWASKNCLRLNASKTRGIIFGTNHAVKNIKSMNLPGIALGNGEITPIR